MSTAPRGDLLLIERIRAGEATAWEDFIGRFEGRLLSFVQSRVRNHSAAEDIVQETLVGFLNSLPNYDTSRPLETYLFTIAAYKLTDHLRREGRRPTIPWAGSNNSESVWEPSAPGQRRPSSLARSGERQGLEEASLLESLRGQIEHWRSRGDWEKIRCIELLFVRGLPNKEVAAQLKLSEQTIANHKFEFLARIKTQLRKQGLSQDVFPELREEG